MSEMRDDNSQPRTVNGTTRDVDKSFISVSPSKISNGLLFPSPALLSLDFSQ